MNCSNRVAVLPAGCPDPGGVLYPQTPVASRPGGAPLPRRAPVPKVTEFVLPASGITVRQLAGSLGLPAFAVMRECIVLGLYLPPGALLDHAAIRRLCSRLGVTIAPGA